jgi:hypothetical protein
MIYVSYFTGKEKHGPRIKVKINNKFVSILISDNPKLSIPFKGNIKNINLILNWIKINKEALLKYWNAKGNMGISKLLNILRK